MKSKFIILSLLITFSSQIFSQNSNVNAIYPFIYSAQKKIMKDSFESAIKDINSAYQFSKLPNGTIGNYLKILEKDSTLRIKYFDTLLYYMAYHSENIEWYSGFKIVQNAIQSGLAKKYKLRDIQANFKCNLLMGELNRIHEADVAVRQNAMKYVAQGDMYRVEPYKSQIFSVDSANYLNLCHLLQVDSLKPCMNSVFDKATILNHLLKFENDSHKVSLMKIMIRLGRADVLDRAKLAINLEQNYNQSLNHKPIPAFNLNSEFVMTTNVMMYQDVVGDELISLNQQRKQFSLEPYNDYIDKILWQRNFGNQKGFILEPLQIMDFPPEMEANIIDKVMKNTVGKKFKLIKFDKPYRWGQ